MFAFRIRWPICQKISPATGAAINTTSVTLGWIHSATTVTPIALSGSAIAFSKKLVTPRKIACTSCTNRLIMSDVFCVNRDMGRFKTWAYRCRRMSIAARAQTRSVRYLPTN